MPELLDEGLPERISQSKFDFSRWADGRAWKFVKGEDYQSTTESFRYNIKRWAKDNGYEASLRPYPAVRYGAVRGWARPERPCGGRPG